MFSEPTIMGRDVESVTGQTSLLPLSLISHFAAYDLHQSLPLLHFISETVKARGEEMGDTEKKAMCGLSRKHLIFYS